ncbi:TerC family protein [Xenorhabdus nematophila]|uniref:TerC family protein n=1 Tax=Xenorhabdus nematophila TaxID=628 RepID=UPI000542320A|nr:TerC family protein [Xenorhabdus nematophila]CEE94730.1 putative transmembrane protein [Xenorhabdus nematophila str. Anatoliense]CEF33004.1 putative transmembrane protein [Xenorhabdus nematophila str. Websteri]AYA40755.1 TerC family protein [Xenorhabdus nematophila]MBA0019497.1 TerC family protein [Xenorhabdus nematophila]MCB4424274.1 CBS domain-containing protein [Xenorhabdus nematophila]
MEWIADPTIWAGLATLIVLEIVLGIDNLIFIAILAEKLPEKHRDKARLTGLSCALLMRILLLFSLSWLISLTKPLVTLWEHPFSARDLIMLIGGIFLLFKATMELNERLEGKMLHTNQQRKGAGFWAVVVQIIVLDAVFSLDSVITAVGMVDHIGIMIAAVIIAMILMIWASKPLTKFVNAHPTIVILCLSFLLMIGFSLVAEGFGYGIPKGYLYAAIGFSIMIESLNQFAQFNRRKFLSASRSLRERTAEAVLHILNGKRENAALDNHTSDLIADHAENKEVFKPQERQMIARVLSMAQRTVSSIMTSRHDVVYLDIHAPTGKLTTLLEQKPHTRIVVTDEQTSDEPLGVVHVIDILNQQLTHNAFDLRQLVQQPLIFPESLSLLQALEQFRQAQTHFAFVVDEFGSVEGVVTVTDVMETITGNLPVGSGEIDARHDIQVMEEGYWVANGFMPLEDLVLYVPLPLDEKREYQTLAGLLMEHLQHIPQQGEQLQIGDYLFEPLEITSHRINKVKITSLKVEEKEGL